MNSPLEPDVTSEELYRVIAEYTYDWESWIDASGRARWINPAVERITGFSVAECLARADYPIGLACEQDRPQLAEVLRAAARGESGNDVEFRVLHKRGEPRWVAISWQALRSPAGAFLGYRTSIRDIEERKRMEAELHVMRRRAESAVVARSELLANVSHELRSPLHGIAGFADLLADSTLDDAQRRYVERIVGECQSMQRHVEDLLQFAALEAGGLQLEQRPFDLDELVREVIEAERASASARELALEAELTLAQRWVEGDRVRLGQVLRNLIANALKFTEHGKVQVALTSAVEGEHTRIEIAVRDSGIGMNADEIERLLEPFQQAASDSARRHAGVGLGLSIVRRLVSAMRGSLRIESELGHGTTVSLRLRLKSAQPVTRALELEPSVTSSHHGETALIVDDKAIARELLRAQLERAGYLVSEAASGPEALACAESTAFDLVLLDYQMPGMDGAETALALRRLARTTARRLRIYLLTANVFVSAELGAAREAIDGILEKPLSKAALSGLLGELADEARAAQRDAEKGARELDSRVIEDLLAMPASDGRPLFVRVLERTREDVPRLLAHASEAAATRRWEEFARGMHELAGVAATIGARELARRARALEQTAHDGPLRPATVAHKLRAVARTWARNERALLALFAAS